MPRRYSDNWRVFDTCGHRLSAICRLDSSLDVRLSSGESINFQASIMSEEKKKRRQLQRNEILPETADKIAEAIRLQRDYGYSKEKVA